VLTCLVIGILSAFEVYAAQLIWPASQPFPNEDTAFVSVAQRAWPPLFAVVGFTLLVANFGSALGAQIGAARLLYGMGRSNALPKSFFGAVDARHRIPRNNVIFVGACGLAAALLVTVGMFSYGLGAEMLNFGALLAFMGVNAAAIVHYYFRQSERTLLNLLPPLAGFVICFALWLGLSRPAKVAGIIWMAAGIAFGAWKTHGFRRSLIDFNLPAE